MLQVATDDDQRQTHLSGIKEGQGIGGTETRRFCMIQLICVI